MSADNYFGMVGTFQAGVDLTGNQYQPVIMSSDGQIDPAGDAAENVIGIQVSKPASTSAGTAVVVALPGPIVKVEAGATITCGATLAAHTGATVADSASGEPRIGIALSAAADGDLFPMLLVHQGDHP